MLRIREMDKKTRVLLLVIGVLIVAVGVTLAYVIAQISTGINNTDVLADTSDKLVFSIDKNISLNPTQFNVTEGGGGLSDTSIGTASLIANSTTNRAVYNYYIYFQITSNNYVYTTEDEKAEIVLTVTDPNGEIVKEASDLKFVSAENADGTVVEGFDITTETGLFTIDMFSITSQSSEVATIQEWEFTVTFINLTTNQTDNGGKTLEAEISFSRYGDAVITAFEDGTITDHKALSNYAVSVDCSEGSGTWDNYSWGVNLNFSTSNAAKCSINYIPYQEKVYLNDYITSLEGTTQGDGELVREIADIYDFNSLQELTEAQYTNIETYYSTSNTSTSGTSINNVFTYINGNWVSEPTNMESDTYYHLKFNVAEEGYYQVCFSMSSGSDQNRFYIYNGTTISMGGVPYRGSSTSSSISDCYSLGYVETTDDIRIVQRAYSETQTVGSGETATEITYPIATSSFSLEKINSVTQEDTGLRFEGFNPNNYVWFNNELWRIIGVFDESSHGQSGEDLVKIIRVENLGGISWDYSSNNDWSTSSLKQLLNGAYYNALDGTDNGYCYGYSTVTKNCNYTDIGINDTYRPMIKNVTWYLGAHGTNTRRADDFYQFERGTRVYSGRPTTDTGYIGLMYPSDYGYSALEDTCTRTYNLSSYTTNNCAGKSWLYGTGYDWTIMPYTNSSYAFRISYMGRLSATYANSGFGVRPVLYLDSSVYRVAGDGTYDNPYIIAMD